MKTITKQKLNELVAKGAFVADMRSPVEFRNAHVSGAVNLPLKQFVNKIMGMAKTTKIVIYSTSIKDVDIKQGINYAEQMGFLNLFVGEYEALKD